MDINGGGMGCGDCCDLFRPRRQIGSACGVQVGRGDNEAAHGIASHVTILAATFQHCGFGTRTCTHALTSRYDLRQRTNTAGVPENCQFLMAFGRDLRSSFASRLPIANTSRAKNRKIAGSSARFTPYVGENLPCSTASTIVLRNASLVLSTNCWPSGQSTGRSVTMTA